MAMTSIYERAIVVLCQEPNERSLSLIEELAPWFCKKSEVLRALNKDVLSDIIRNCEFCRRCRDDIIIKQKDRGDCFYIILRGKVSIYIQQTISDEDEETAGAEKAKIENYFTEDGQLDRSKFGNYINFLDDGKSFGELALLQKDCIRNASIIADDAIDLVVINRDLFNRCLRAAQAADLEQRISFVKEHRLFEKWAPKYKKQMAMSMRKQTISFDEPIVRQCATVTALYFLLSGQAKIIIDSSKHDAPTTQNLLNAAHRGGTDAEELLSSSLNSPSVDEVDQRHGTKLLKSSKRSVEKRRKTEEVCLVERNEVIGDIEFVLGLKKHLQTVRCVKVCEVFALDSRNFDRLISKRNPRTVDAVRDLAIIKASHRLKRMPPQQASLFQVLIDRMEDMARQQLRREELRATVKMTSNRLLEDICPQRGAIINMYGPGTIFHRNRLRREAKEKMERRLRDGEVHGGEQLRPVMEARRELLEVRDGDKLAAQGNSIPTAESKTGDQLEVGAASDSLAKVHIANREIFEATADIELKVATNDDEAEQQLVGPTDKEEAIRKVSLGQPATFSEQANVLQDAGPLEVIPLNGSSVVLPLNNVFIPELSREVSALGVLEERLRLWHRSFEEEDDKYLFDPMQFSTRKVINSPYCVFKLRRVDLQGIDLKPGKMLTIRRRQPPSCLPPIPQGVSLVARSNSAKSDSPAPILDRRSQFDTTKSQVFPLSVTSHNVGRDEATSIEKRVSTA